MNWKEYGIDEEIIDTLSEEEFLNVYNLIINKKRKRYAEKLNSFEIANKVQLETKDGQLLNGMVIGIGKKNLKIVVEGGEIWRAHPMYVTKV